MIKYFFLTVSYSYFLIHDANAADCRWFGRDAQIAIKHHVAALQRFEHEASDRLKGLDTRPFEVLLTEARKVTAIIADPVALKDEEGLERCRNWTRQYRKMCAVAAQKLVDALEKYSANPKPDYDKPQYATAMTECETAMGLKPLKSLIRGTD
jgi:hypothetical protein